MHRSSAKCAARRVIFILAALLTLGDFANADIVAKLESAEGDVQGLVAPAKEWAAVDKGQGFSAGDSIKTKQRSRAGLRFVNGYFVRLSSNSSMQFKDIKGGQMNLRSGRSHFFSRQSQNFPAIRTRHVSASVRGTEFTIEVKDEETIISVFDGAVEARNDQGSVTLAKGEMAVARAGEAPVKQLLAKPADAVEWALYYPAVLDFSDFADYVDGSESAGQREAWIALQRGDVGSARKLLSGNSWRDFLGRSIANYQSGEIAGAFRELQNARMGDSGSLHLLQSALLLAVGEVDQARGALSSLERDLDSGRYGSAAGSFRAAAASQRAVIALVRNELESAKTLSSTALAHHSDSVSALVAASYVAQAEQDLALASAHLERAVRAQPGAAFPKARYAELLLGSGEADSARDYANEAVRLQPTNAYALTVLGFSNLVSNSSEEASRRFEEAKSADGAFALAHLGSGLAEIKQGKLDSGVRQLERAVHLSPLVALYRSYLGKGFYEQFKGETAAKEYQRAIELDPNDPTPYLYRSYLNLEQHKPIQALRDLQQSIEKNDNRAVYRSKLLLDQDAGTRSAGLGRIYSRLGFTELARLEAIKSLSKDYGNYSAHYLLADAYRDSHLNSRAQATENLLGRLLSPVTYNSNSLNTAGAASLNEYSTLFEQPINRYQVGVTAESSTESIGGLAEVTGSNGELGYNLGYSGGYRSGFRESDWERLHQVFTQGQYRLSDDATLIWDGAVSVNDKGDTVINYDPYAEDLDFQSKLDSYLVRAGYHRKFDATSHLLFQAFYNFSKFDDSDLASTDRIELLDIRDSGSSVRPDPFTFPGSTDVLSERDEHLVRADLQYMNHLELVSYVAGASYSFERVEGNDSSTISSIGDESSLDFLVGLPLSSDDTIDQHTYRAYLYSTWHLLDWLDLDAGVTYAKIKLSQNALEPPYVDDTYSEDQISPKFGLVAEPLPGTLIRASYSRTLDRTERGAIGPLEKTFVGGFNQVFDGVRGSEQDLFSVGIDQRIGNSTFLGVSYQHRDVELNVPTMNGGVAFDRTLGTSTEVLFPGEDVGDVDIDRLSAYFYQILCDNVSLTLDYDWENFDEASPFPETDTYRVAPRVNYFHPSGLFAFGAGTWRSQDRGGDLTEKTEDDFLIFDIGFGYELDNRQGAVTLTFKNVTDEDFEYSAITDESLVLPEFGAELAVSFSF